MNNNAIFQQFDPARAPCEPPSTEGTVTFGTTPRTRAGNVLSSHVGEASGIELWNVHPGVVSLVGAQERFLVLGRIDRPKDVGHLTYSLNGGRERPVVVRTEDPTTPTRLSATGDFSIDTIEPHELRPSNDLRVTAYGRDGDNRTRDITFHVGAVQESASGSQLDLHQGEHAQQLCQLVDGRWRRAIDRLGRACLQISAADAGYDRVALFTPPIAEPAYTLSMRVRVEDWTHRSHHIGLVFGWRDHLQGNGHVLPRDWTTGLAYYYSHCPGLRLRVGENVQYSDDGRKHGDRVLAERPLSWRHRLQARASDRVSGGKRLRQIRLGRDYWLRLRVTPDHYSFSVWPDGQREPQPRLTASTDGVTAAFGAGGIIAHNCAVNVYEYKYDVGNRTSQ